MTKYPKRQRRGATSVEFAIVAVPMIIMVFGCLEVSRLFMINSMAENAVFESLRHVMVSGSKKAEGVAKANEMLALFGTQNATVVVTPYEGGVATPEITDNTEEISVSISIPMSSNSFLLSAFTHRMTIQHQARIYTERYKGFYDGQSAT